jgi:nucleotide-binding universal stress UspA family protein
LEQYGDILCALDFSPHADAAFQSALELAREESAQLTLLHVYVPGTPLLPGEKPAKAKTLGDQDLAARLRTYIEEEYLAQAGEVPCRVVLRRGHPSVEILAHLDENPADLVVMGSQGLSGMGLVILGSVAERVVRKAACDCLLVRPPQEPAA